MAISSTKPISATYLQTQLKNFDSTILVKKYNKAFQVTTMPTASADEVGKVYQYVGGTSSDYTFGYFYTSKAAEGGYKWEAVTQEAPDYTIEKIAPSGDTFTATYVLKKDGTAIGDSIDIPKDYFVTDATIGEVTEADLGESGKLAGKAGFAVGDTYLQLDINIAGKPTNSTKSVFVNISSLIDVYTAGDAISIDASNKNAISVVTETDSGLKTVNKKLAVDFEAENITFDYSTWETA